ncbi:mitochondrial sodium/calcium exchanger protein [Ischnura elegans]|uniref:mitochondrial sodium/calcium exchanger protein n=1 Tax=Ischnura elegans TaxID=197161 RepID=UPI001ED8BB5E|nr:mitochondrial sodium/calcium exchanger protein [Ischnura elegans]
MNASSSYLPEISSQSLEKCFSIQNITPEAQCDFVKATEDCTYGEALISYITFIYCSFDPSQQLIGLFTILFWMLILFIALGTTADSLFCPALTVIAKILRLSENLAGVTVLAFGNGSPDVFTAVAGAASGRTELVYGELFGSGMFVTTVVAGLICIICPFVVMERPFLRDTIFYMGAAFWAFYVFYKGKISLWESIGFVILYFFYIIVVVGGRACERWKHKVSGSYHLRQVLEHERKRASVDSLANIHHSAKSSVCVDLALQAEQICQLALLSEARDGDRLRNGVSSEAVEHCTTPLIIRATNGENFCNLLKDAIAEINPINKETWYDSRWYSRIFLVIKMPVFIILKLLVPVVNYTSERDGWCKLLNVFHCITTPLFCAFATGLANYNLLANFEDKTLPFWVILLLVCSGISITVFCTSKHRKPPSYHAAFAFLGFVGSIVLIYMVANEIISLLRTVGIFFQINETSLGLTVLAWGNSIGDFVTDLTIARQGYERMGFSACFGGPLFNSLLGIGVSFTIACVQNDGEPILLTYGGPAPILTAFIFISLISSFIAFPAMKFKANRCYGYYLISLYVLFVALTVTFECGYLPLYSMFK